MPSGTAAHTICNSNINGRKNTIEVQVRMIVRGRFCFFVRAHAKQVSSPRCMFAAQQGRRQAKGQKEAGCCAAWVNTSELDARHGNVRFAFRLPDLFNAGGQNVRLHAMAAGGLMFER